MTAAKKDDNHAILINVPKWIVTELDREAERLGVPRVNVIIVELAKKAEQMRAKRRGK